MGRAFVSVRGYVEHPCLLEVDLERAELVRKIEVPCDLPESATISKRGFLGLGWHRGLLYAATWDRICIIDPETGKLCDTITDRRFSDLHSLHVDKSGVLWVTSTNLDGIYTIRDGGVEPYWHAWEADESPDIALDDHEDYRKHTKSDDPFHKFHVNAVHATDSVVLATFLGRPPEVTSFQAAIAKFGVRTWKHRAGGMFVLDKPTRRVLKTVPMEGLHDLIPGGDGFLYSTQYFGETLVQWDPATLTARQIPLEIGPWGETGYLARGVLWKPDGFWVGHTRHRGWMQKDPSARIRFYTHDGRWTGREIVLPEYSGVYDIVPRESVKAAKAVTRGSVVAEISHGPAESSVR